MTGVTLDPQRTIVLVGLMASGKTTIAEALARRLGRALRDSDRDIEAATGQTVADLAQSEGVEAMHARERTQLFDVLTADVPVIAAVAASVVDDVRGVDALRAAQVVWLRARPATLAARFSRQGHRPRFGRDPRALLTEQMATRGPVLEQVADLVVDVDDLAPHEVVDRIVAALGTVG